MNWKYIFGLMASVMIFMASVVHAQDYDLVISGGRVMDPETGLNEVRDVGVKDGQITAISETPLQGSTVINAAGLVVAPGFIDLHAHGFDEMSSRLKVQDGVTTHLELEGGSYPVALWYARMSGTSPIHYGTSVSHGAVRIAVMNGLIDDGPKEDPTFAEKVYASEDWMRNEADPATLEAIKTLMKEGLADGGLGFGLGIEYTPGARREEVYALFNIAGQNGVTSFVHTRSAGNQNNGGSIDAVQELIAGAASTGSSAHMMHVNSMGADKVPDILAMFDGAQKHGIDVSADIYPWIAFSTNIGAAFFEGDFREQQGLDYSDFLDPTTGKFLDEKSFRDLRRKAPATEIIGYSMKEETISFALAHPSVIIGSDGMRYINGKAHPRGAGSFSRVLGYYVRERGDLSLMNALAKMTLLPAKRLENFVPQMKSKGRIKVGADADITIFNPSIVRERATFEQPAQPSIGIEYVIVAGTEVISKGAFIEGLFPGKAIRRSFNGEPQ